MAGLWSWLRRTVTETGVDPEIPIALERTADGGYAFRLGARAGFGGQDTARIPIFRRLNPSPHPILKEVHYCEVGGRTLEAANVYALQRKVAAWLEQVAPARSLPLCYFRAPAMDYELPVYEEGGEFVAPMVGGANIKADDLSAVRAAVCRYLANAGYVHDVDEVTVGVLRPSDLRRVPPAAVYRSLSDPALWLPSVEGTSPDGPVIGLLASATRLRRRERRRMVAGPRTTESAPAAPDAVELLRYLRTELARGARPLADPAALYAAEVREEIWRGAERSTTDSGRRLVAYMSDDEATRLEMPVRRTGFGEVVTALEDRGINVFLAPDEDALAAVVGRYLAAEDFLRFATEVEIHAVEAPRAEQLDADSISTPGQTRTYEEVTS